jgi:Luciferase-like monooxygenase
MLKVGVKLPGATGRIGDYLADVTALEAAGADSIWLDARPDTSIEPWILLGAIAAVTHRMWLGVMVGSAVECQPALGSLQRLSGGRMVVGVGSVPDIKQSIDLIRTVRSGAPPPRILIAHDSSEEAVLSVLAEGVIVPGGQETVRGLRDQLAGQGDVELWVDTAIPPDRAGWAQLVAAHEATDATGVIVAWDPRLIDLLRSGGEPDDRTDLLIATG